LRVGVTIVGIVLLVLALLVFADGNNKLAALNACATLRVCSQGTDPTGPNFSASLASARTEVAYGVVFGSIGFIIFMIGILGVERKRKRKKSPRTAMQTH
jgi:uncharacterized membrane protein